jgi:hypothetical protein
MICSKRMQALGFHVVTKMNSFQVQSYKVNHPKQLSFSAFYVVPACLQEEGWYVD